MTPDVQILTLEAECERLRRALEHIATAKVSDGYRAGFYALRWHARTTLDGTLSPSRGKRRKVHAR